MQKRKVGKKLSREKAQRGALLHGLARALVEREKIRTTLAKAKALSPLVEHLITRAKKGDVASARKLTTILGKDMGKKMKTLVLSFKDRKGGYTRVIKLGRQKENSAEMAVIEFVK